MTIEEFLNKPAFNLTKEEKTILLDYLMSIRIGKIVKEINKIKEQL
ncbi:MAG: hypothetical protein LBE91_08205 [Tannerella sp.]|jgi:hypothetical protein|nr:hypothetical protein [Tannerella sp.]